MGKAAENKREKRTALMRSAYELFSTIGFSKTTIRDIAHKAGVAKGTFYLYFKDKDHIMEDLIRYHASKLLVESCKSMDAEIVRSSEPMPLEDKFIYIIDYIVDHVVADKALLKLVSKNLTWGLFTHDMVATEKDGSTVQSFESYIFSMLSSEEAELRSPRLLIFTLLDLVSSTCYDTFTYGVPVTLEEYKPYLHDCIRLLVTNAIV